MVRHRAFLLSLAVLPQLLALAVLVSMFWVVRVREIVVASVRTAEARGREVLRCAITPADAGKLAPRADAEVELLGPGDEILATGRGVIGDPVRLGSGGLTVDVAGPGLAEVARRAKLSGLSRARIAVRTRRALTVILEARAGGAKGGRRGGEP